MYYLVKYYQQESTEESQARRRDLIGLFGEKFGDYPFEKYGVVFLRSFPDGERVEVKDALEVLQRRRLRIASAAPAWSPALNHRPEDSRLE